MTLTEARRTLERHRNEFTDELGEAVDAAISILPYVPEKPKVEDRIREMTGLIGYDPFNDRRYRKDVVLRQCIIFKLHLEGFQNCDITRATGLNHSTVTHSIAATKDGLAYNDILTHKAWKNLLEKIEKT